MKNRTDHGRMKGLTLIELMVAMLIGLIVVLATVSALTVARRGFTTVDAASQLRDSGRFAADLIQRVSAQAGYRDVFVSAGPPSIDPAREANVGGFNNALLNATTPTTASTARTSTVTGYGSDILILRYQASQLYSNSTDSTSAKIADQTMIDCAGNTVAAVADPNDSDPAQVGLAYDRRIISIFHVAINQGEPALMCTYSSTGAAPWTTVPVIQGVENFQVLYGVDDVTAGAAPAAAAPVPDVPDSYLRADQMVVATSANDTRANWRRVRSIRIGLVLRTPPGATQDNAAQTFYPFGAAKASSTGSIGSALASSNDIGTIFAPTPDGRLRQVLSFAIHLRNDQGL